MKQRVSVWWNEWFISNQILPDGVACGWIAEKTWLANRPEEIDVVLGQLLELPVRFPSFSIDFLDELCISVLCSYDQPCWPARTFL